MQFDDRLATVLRMRTDSEGGLRTQFRQLLDLLGTSREETDSPLADEAYARLGEIMEKLPQEEQSRILREPGLRLRNSELVAFLADGNAKPAASAMATARLTEAQWLELIPTLPVNARGFLRHRRDLSTEVKALLSRLGVQDLVLPDPLVQDPTLAPAPAPSQAASPIEAAPVPVEAKEDEGIGALLRRIEQFREDRRTRPVAPRLPLGEDDIQHTPLLGFEFASDASGAVTWASGPIAPLVVGLMLTSPRPGMLVEMGEPTARDLADRQPVHSAPVTLDAAPEISGDWRLDAAPLFDPLNGRFNGYRGCLRRPVIAQSESEQDSAGDQMRQVLHELRTPVNAIQGFAEIIQQQLFGPAPHEYRAHAAGISVDAAKLLAAFDEVDRLVKLDSGAMHLEDGETDMRSVVAETTQRLQGVLRPRNAGFDLRVKGSPFDVAMARPEAMALCWRILATAAGALGPGEQIALRLSGNGKRVKLRLKVPQSLLVKSATGQRPSGDPARERALSAGMFGPDFAFKLAQAEAEATGGTLKCKKDRVTLLLPALTATAGDHSAGSGRTGDSKTA
ncbi:sensor histidine kinase [Aurantiacibacter sp. D1-12]|uniref:sensor histidine kinase n=1 Tax=Aurantiacibacter sp. D1-12 TaxID=2993658 RepID=UPI00237CC479|nr:histidine kinase dimerization/phospho-acceptor domain-containing protein [Aurantiacibacter sp. D1-12]MDE1466398.1 sensor histidine kinase [Aurantiacibacter sp. D1-12]